MVKASSVLRVDPACGNVCLYVTVLKTGQVLLHLKTIGEADLHCAVATGPYSPAHEIKFADIFAQ